MPPNAGMPEMLKPKITSNRCSHR